MDEGGIGARGEADEKEEGHHAGYRRGVGQHGGIKGLSDQPIESRKKEYCRDDRHREGYEVEEQRFPDELPEQLASQRAEYFADADLGYAARGLGCGEIGIIDGGDAKDEQGDSGKDVDIGDVAIRGLSTQL